MPRFGVSHTDRPVLADGPGQLPRRAGRGGRRRDPRTRPRPPPAPCASTTGSCRASTRSTPRWRPARTSCRTRRSARATPLADTQRPRGRALRLGRHRGGGGAHRRRRRERPTRSRWSRTSRSSRAAPSSSRPTPGGLDVYSPVQHPYLLQRTIASVLGLPLNQVRVFAPDPGGGFGGKQNPKLEPLLAFLALRTRRTCRLVLSLEETFQSMRRAGCRITARTGFTGDGELTFHRVEADFQIGAYADVAPRVMGKGSYVAAGPYRIPGGADRRPRGHDEHDPEHRLPRLRQPAGRLGDGVAARRRRPGCWASTAWRSGGATWSPRARRSSAASPPPTADGEWQQSLEKAAELIGWGDAAAAEPRPGHRRGHQAGRDLRALAEPGPAAVRRQRDRLRGHLRHGPGRAHAVAADRRRRARDAARPASASSAATPAPCRSTCRPRPAGRRSSWARPCWRPASDVRQRVLELYAESTGVPADQLDERPGVLVTPDGELSLPEAARAGARVAARRVHRPGHPAAARQEQAPARRRRGVLRVQRHRDRGRGRPGDRRAAADPARDRQRRRHRAQPAAGRLAGRGRRDHGPGPQPDGAAAARRARPDPQPRRARLPDPDVQGRPAWS